ncbi:MAG: hypothetical protein ACRELB_13360, partial [Polyangiaceae bacterium]
KYIEAMKFADAQAALKAVVETGDAASKAKATDRLGSRDVVQGLAYEAALGIDKKAALPKMEAVAASGAPVSAKANEWLGKERPGILLADATAACSATPPSPCPDICDRLSKLHGETPEAQKAGTLLAAYQAADAARVYPLLVQAEGLMAQCQAYWRQEKARNDCQLRNLAMTDNALAALVACGDSDGKTKDKLTESMDKVTGDIAEPSVVGSLKERFDKACDDGDYQKQTPPKPSAGGVALPNSSAGDGTDAKHPALPSADDGFVDTRGGWGWGDKCFVNIKTKTWGWAKAECDKGLAMADPTTPQPRASLFYNEGLIAKGMSDFAAARSYFQQSLSLREHPEVRAALDSLPPR